MFKPGNRNFAVLVLTATLTFLCNPALSQNNSISSIAVDCTEITDMPDGAEAMALQLSCYNQKLNALAPVMADLLQERQRLSKTLGTVKPDFKESITADSEKIIEQQKVIETLQLERANLSAQLHRLLSDNQYQQLSREADERLFKHYSDTYISLNEENKQLREMLAEYQDSMENLEIADGKKATRIYNLNGELANLTAENTALDNDVSKLKLTVADLSTRKKRLENDIADSNASLSESNNQLDTASTQITALKQSIRVLTKQHREQIENFNAKTTNLNQRIATLTSERDKIQSKAEQESANAATNLAARDDEIQQHQIQIDALKTSLLDSSNQHSEQIKNITSETENLNQRIAALIRERNRINSTLNEKSSEIVSLKSAAENAKSSFEQQLTAVTDSRDKLQDEQEILLGKIATRDKNLEKITSKMNASNTALKKTTEQVAVLSRQLQAANTTSDSIATKRDQLASDNDSLRQQADKSSMTLTALQTERDRLADRLDQAEPQIKNLTDTVTTLNLEKQALNQDIETLNEELRQAISSTEELQTQLASSEEQRNLASNKIKTLTNTVGNLEAILSESLASNKHIEATLSDIKKNLNASQTRLDRKQQELQALAAEKAALIKARNELVQESKRQAQAIKTKLSENGFDAVQVDVLDDQSLVLLVGSNELFRTGSSLVSQEGQKILATLGSAIAPFDDKRIMIEGHSDNVPLGARLAALFKDNLGLSMARAVSASKFLTSNAGIPANRISVSGAGDTKPLASNDTPQGRQQNRRIEIMLIPATERQIASASSGS